jgi:hypothetical protein
MQMLMRAVDGPPPAQGVAGTSRSRLDPSGGWSHTHARPVLRRSDRRIIPSEPDRTRPDGSEPRAAAGRNHVPAGYLRLPRGIRAAAGQPLPRPRQKGQLRPPRALPLPPISSPAIFREF